MRQCEIYLHGIRCGLLTEDDNRTFTFTYDKAYLIGDNAEPVNLTSTLREGFSTYSLVAVKALFDGIQVPHIFLEDHPIYPR